MGYIDLNSACDYYVPHNTLYVKPLGKSIYCIFIFLRLHIILYWNVFGHGGCFEEINVIINSIILFLFCFCFSGMCWHSPLKGHFGKKTISNKSLVFNYMMK